MIKEDVIYFGKRIYENGLSPATSGNISCISADNNILITASGSAAGDLTFEAINSISSELCKKYLKNTNRRFTIECNLSDPCAMGEEETYTINGVTFDEFPLANWQKGALIEKTFNFRASDVVIVDLIN